MREHKVKFIYVIYMVSLLVFLHGCGNFLALEGVSVIASEKTLSDHLVSLISGKNCSVVRTERELAYCAEDQPPIIRPSVYCYQTLGSVSCYNRPDPRRANHQLMGQGEHNLGQ